MSNADSQRQRTIETEQKFEETLKLLKLNQENLEFDQNRYLQLARLVRKLSRTPRSVTMIKHLLNVIFLRADAEKLQEFPEKQLDCIGMKFKICADLALSCKISLQDLIKYASATVHGNITYLLILNGGAISFIEYFLSLEFFTTQILPRSWFYLLRQDLIDANVLQNSLLKIKKQGKYIFQLQAIKNNLFECIVKVAFTSKMNQSQKRQMIQLMKQTFKMDSQEWQVLYNSRVGNTEIFFESLLLHSLMKRLGLQNKYFLEKLLHQAEKQQTLEYFNAKWYIKHNFLNSKTQCPDLTKKFNAALEFLHREFKSDGSIQHSDFSVCFLETLNNIFSFSLEQEQEKMKRQSAILLFIRTIDILLRNQMVDEFSKKAIVLTSIYILRIGIEKEETVEMSIFAMQILLNAIGLKHTIVYLDRFFSLTVHAYLNFPEQKKIQKYTSKIFSFYLKEKFSYTQGCFKDLQFILLKQLKDNPHIREHVGIIASDLYKSKEDIEHNLKIHVQSLSCANEDIRILSVMYILELLEQKENDRIRQVLIEPKILKVVYQSILELRQKYKTEKNRILSIYCAKVIAYIGLCQPFINDPIFVETSNQETRIMHQGIDEEQKSAGSMQQMLLNDYYNPVTSQKKTDMDDNILERMAVPSLKQIILERQDSLEFAKSLFTKIKQLQFITQEKPKNFFYTQFLLKKFIDNRSPQRGEDLTLKQDALTESVVRFSDIKMQQFEVLESYKNKTSLKNFAFYLILKIEEESWRLLFEACVPLLNKSTEVLELLLPYIIYYALRFNLSDPTLHDTIANHMNEILDFDYSSHIEPILRVQDFLKIALQQDKLSFKVFIEAQTKFKYVEKLFYLEFDQSKVKDHNIASFLKTIEDNSYIKTSFMTVKKIKQLFAKMDKFKTIKGAKHIKNYKRCVYYFEDSYRGLLINSNKGFLDVLSQEHTIEVVNLHKQLNPEDFDQPLFNSIMNSSKMILASQMNQLSIQDKQEQNRKHVQNLFRHPQVAEDWKSGRWDAVQQWFGDINIFDLDSTIIYFDRETDNPILQFEIIIGIFVAEYSKGLKHYITSGDSRNEHYITSLKKVEHFFKLLYHEFMLNLDEKQGEISYFFKLFLHVTYELEASVHYLKAYLFQENEKLVNLWSKEVNQEKRKFEKIYYDFDMNGTFEKLLSWFEERSQGIQSSVDSLKLIFNSRRMIFQLYDRENEYAFYLMKITRLYRKSSNDILTINRLLKECEQNQGKILDYDLEYAKYTLRTKNAHEAYQYLQSKLEHIKQKQEASAKQYVNPWMPQRVYERATLLSLDLQIKLDPRNTSIIKRFDEFIKELGKAQWEKPLFKYGQYLDLVDQQSDDKSTQFQQEAKKRMIQKIFYYITSLKSGHKYIWQSLPRALELWFDYNDNELDVDKINTFMKQELSKIEIYKVATVLQIFLSRYGHSKEAVREIIILVLARIAIEWPGHCAWWIYHFLHFEQETGQRKQQLAKPQVISRADFAKNLLNKILQMNDLAYKKIIECEKIFIDLKRLSEKSPSSPNQSSMDLPQSLQRVTQSNLVMPIEKNLSPQLPPINYKVKYFQTNLTNTMRKIADFSEEIQTGSFMPDFQMEESKEEKEYPAFYNEDIVYIRGFIPEATIMLSKEKPKKIGIKGSDGQNYSFLLKCDKYGDLRKEQRFIDFAVLCNKMLENDSESRKRNLKLRTYAIVPLSRNSGLIEWIQNTSTLKSVVGECWKKNNTKGEMQDIKQKAQQLKAGDSHTQIWHVLKDDIRPVLGVWMAEHFPSPELWYEAKINFIRSTAIWSMIGYVIGLGDRHGDNILIHNHTGEVTHVDFDCIFEKGTKLKIPEIVPFRLTSNIIDGFGIFKEKGVFTSTCEVVQRVLRKNSSNIVSFLYSFIHDPLIESTNNIKVDISQALEVVKKKLHGQIHEKGGGSMTIEEQVEYVVLLALNDEALSKMYVGWMPWL